jgi:hypothetical protein
VNDIATGSIDFAAQQAISGQLGSGERLLWAGSPRPGVRLQAVDAILIPFSLAWGGFACFWEYEVITSGAPLVMRLFGLPFVFIGLFLVVGRFFVDAWRRRSTFYGLTNQRALIASGRQVRSLNLQTLGDVTLSERPDGSGTILFAPAGAPMAWARATTWVTTSRGGPPSFEMVPGARQVCDRIRTAQREASSQGA